MLGIDNQIVISSPRIKLNDNLNTKYRESKPVISPDGGKLYFVRRNAPDNKGKKSDDQNIYVSN